MASCHRQRHQRSIMTRIKLTKDDFSYIHWDKDSAGPELFELIIYGESKYDCDTIKQQILENQKIVDVLKVYHTNIEKHPLLLPSKDDDTVGEIEKMAKDRNMTFSEFVRQAVRYAMDNIK